MRFIALVLFALPIFLGCSKSSEYLYPWTPKIQENPVLEKRPTCKLSLSSASVYVDQTITAQIDTTGNLTEIKWGNETLPASEISKTLNTSAAGHFTLEVIVAGPGGAGSCQAEYDVKDYLPACTVEVSPGTTLVGDSVIATLKTVNKISKASIGATPVAFPVGQLQIATPAAGSFTVVGNVEGPGGKASCQAYYTVKERPPTCTLVASPNSVLLGDSIKFSIVTSGVTTGATIEGQAVNFPNGTLTLTPSFAGAFTATGRVTGPGGDGECQAKYEVKERPPTCTVSANPGSSLVGDEVTLTITGKEKVNESYINGNLVASPLGTLKVTSTDSGTFTVKGEVRGPGGIATCQTTYSVKDRPPTCEVAADPSSVMVGTPVTLRLTSKGKVTKADIDGTAVTIPVGTKAVQTPDAGTFPVKGSVTGPGGSATCATQYSVKDYAPTCTLTASPNVFLQGKSTILTLKTVGKVTKATVDGMTIAFPNGTLTVTPTSPGKKTSTAFITGPGGDGRCTTDYGVAVEHQFTKTVKEISTTTDIDLLWVIDNSPSMDVYQKAVQDNTKVFMDEYSKIPNLKWKMGLISTSDDEQPYVGFTPATKLDYQSTDPVKIFQDAVGKLGVGGSSIEKTFTPVQKAIDAYPDFLRKDAGLAIMALTDAMEQSSVTPKDFIDYLVKKKGDIKKVIGYGAFSTEDFGCEGNLEDPWKYAGSLYETFIKGTNGKAYKLCTPDFGKLMLDVAQQIITSLSTTPKIPLGTTPVPGTIVVKYKGKVLPEGPKPTGNWIFLPAENAILFNDLDFATGDKEQVEITFQEVP